MLMVNASDRAVTAPGADAPTPPGETCEIDDRLCYGRRGNYGQPLRPGDRGVRLASVIESVAPQFVPAAEADRARVLEQFVEELPEVVREQEQLAKAAQPKNTDAHSALT